jgi:hypothetical protein
MNQQTAKILYSRWNSMRTRVSNNKKYGHRYFQRGITVCPEWNDFGTFAEWAVKNGFSPDLDLDRIDNDKGYCPDNCRFVTKAENTRNRDMVNVAAQIKRVKTEKMARPFRCAEDGFVYLTQIEASRCLGVDRKSLRLALQGKYKQAGGYHFEYLDGYKQEDVALTA